MVARFDGGRLSQFRGRVLPYSIVTIGPMIRDELETITRGEKWSAGNL